MSNPLNTRLEVHILTLYLLILALLVCAHVVVGKKLMHAYYRNLLKCKECREKVCNGFNLKEEKNEWC